MVTILFILLLIVVGLGSGVAGVLYLNEKRRRELGTGSRPKQLAPEIGSGAVALERTLRELRTGDILTYDRKDYLVEGVVSYDEDGHRWCAGRIVDGDDTRWLLVGVERMTATIVRMLSPDKDAEIVGYPPDALVMGEIRYTLDKRGTATCRFSGELGGLAGVREQRPDGTVERCRWWLYGAAGDDTMIVEQWSGEYRVLRGKKLAADLIEMLAAS